MNKNDLFYLAEIIAENKSLNSLNLSSNYLFDNFDKIKFEDFCEVIIRNENLYYLNVSDNLLGENAEICFLLVKALEKNKGLKSLDLSDNKIGNYKGNLDAIISLIENKKLSKIFLETNRLGEPELLCNMVLLIKAIEKNVNLKYVFLSYNLISVNEKIKEEIDERLRDRHVLCLDELSNGELTDNSDSNFFSDYENN
jgi:Ran GTPase-activating protein (RanGAP) involved in mRNA processing and transport